MTSANTIAAAAASGASVPPRATFCEARITRFDPRHHLGGEARPRLAGGHRAGDLVDDEIDRSLFIGVLVVIPVCLQVFNHAPRLESAADGAERRVQIAPIVVGVVAGLCEQQRIA